MHVRRCCGTNRRCHEQGFTLVEVTVAAALMLAVVGMFLDALAGVTHAQVRVNALVTNEQTVRFALDQLQRDLRAANPVDVDATTSAYPDQVQIELGPNPGARSYIRWVYETGPGSAQPLALVRQIVSGPDPTATVVSQEVFVTGVQNASAGSRVFTYFDAAGNDLVAANSATPANVADCVIRIGIRIQAESLPGPAPFSESMSVELRNRLPGGIEGCP